MNATSTTSVNFAPKHLSGIDVIDDAWGGLYRGGSYLVYGRAASGRGLLTLMFARTGAAFSEPTLLVSPDRQKDLMIQAASIGFNLREAHDSGIVRLLRVPPLMNLQNMGDDGVSKALWDLVTLIRRHRPTRLIMNDFMPFVAFRSFDRFRNEFIQFLEQIDSLDTTTLLVMPEPANPQSSRVIEFMASQMTGSIHIELAEDSPTTTKRRISLIPHIGHIKRQVVDYWDLEDLIQTTKAPSRAPEPPEESKDALIFTPTSYESPHETLGHSSTSGYDRPEQSPSRADSVYSPGNTGSRRPHMPPVIPGPGYAPAPAPAPNPTFSPQVPSQAPPQPAAPYSEQTPYSDKATFAGNPAYTAPPQGGVAPGGSPSGEQARQAGSVQGNESYLGNAPQVDPNRAVPPFFGGSPSGSAPQSSESDYMGAPGMGAPGMGAPGMGAPGIGAANPSQATPPPQEGSPSSGGSFMESESVFSKQRPAENDPRGFERPQTTPQAPPATPQAPRQAPPVPPQAPPIPYSTSTSPTQRPAPFVPPAQQAPETPFTPASGMNVEAEYTNREAFRERLQHQFSNRDVLHQPFLLLALRMDRSAQSTARPFDFDFLMDLVGEELRVQDDMLANIDLERLVVYLADSRPEEAQSFFTRLKDRLRQESPTQADHLLHSVSAIVVPDGRPFQNAGEFLNYALDEA